MDTNVLAVFLIDGTLPHRFTLAEREVVLDLFPVGTAETIERQVSGLDVRARQVVLDVMELAHSIRSVGGYDFKQSLEEKLRFVRGMPIPVFELFVEELKMARLAQREKLAALRDTLKKSSPNPA